MVMAETFPQWPICLGLSGMPTVLLSFLLFSRLNTHSVLLNVSLLRTCGTSVKAMSHFNTIQDLQYLPFKLMSPGILMCMCVCVCGGSHCVSQSSLCVMMQRPTNLIQTSRLPDKRLQPRRSPPPPLITAAIKWPVWTCDVLDMNQGSAALVSQLFLGKQPRGLRGNGLKGPHISIRIPSHLLCVSVRARGWQIYPPPPRMTFGLLYICYKSASFRAADTLLCESPPNSGLQFETVSSFSGGGTHRLQPEGRKSGLFLFVFLLNQPLLVPLSFPGTRSLTGGFAWSGSHLHTVTAGPHPRTNAVLLGSLAVFPMPCLETRGPAPDMAQTVNSSINSYLLRELHSLKVWSAWFFDVSARSACAGAHWSNLWAVTKAATGN